MMGNETCDKDWNFDQGQDWVRIRVWPIPNPNPKSNFRS